MPVSDEEVQEIKNKIDRLKGIWGITENAQIDDGSNVIRDLENLLDDRAERIQKEQAVIAGIEEIKQKAISFNTDPYDQVRMAKYRGIEKICDIILKLFDNPSQQMADNEWPKEMR